MFEGSQAYVRFAINNSDTFKIMFSGVLEKEYPPFVEISHKTFELVVSIIRACQDAGILRSTPPGQMAVTVWGQVHGIISLALEGQISRSALERHTIQTSSYFPSSSWFSSN